jgi:hypothetical protein
LARAMDLPGKVGRFHWSVVLGADQDVGRLGVAMGDVLLMGMLNGIADTVF